MIQQQCYHQTKLKEMLQIFALNKNKVTPNLNEQAQTQKQIASLLQTCSKEAPQNLQIIFQTLFNECQPKHLNNILTMYKSSFCHDLNAQQQLIANIQKLFYSQKNQNQIKQQLFNQSVKVLIDFIMIDNFQFCSQIISKSLRNKKFCYYFLVNFNNAICSQKWNQQSQDLEDNPMNGYDLNDISYLAFNIVKNEAKESSFLIDQALHFITVLVLLKPQEMQIFNQLLINSIVGLVSDNNLQKQVGFAYRLLAAYLKWSKQTNNPIFNEDFLISIYTNLCGRINLNQTNFQSQIQKLKHHLNFIQSRGAISFLRGVSIFIYEATKYLCFINNQKCWIFMQFAKKLVQCNDSVMFQANFQALNEFSIQIDQNKLIQSIVNNCPSIEQTHYSIQYADSIKNNLQKLNFFNDFQFRSVSLRQHMYQVLNRIDIIQNQPLTLVEKVAQKIKLKIEKQFDTQFDSYQFQSACNTFFILTDYAVSKNQNLTDVKVFKQQLINEIKFLTNLNQSCLAQHKKIVCKKIIQFFSHCYLVVLPQNQFLQEVIQKLLVERYPRNKKQLINLIQFYQNYPDIFEKGYSNKYAQKQFSNLCSQIGSPVQLTNEQVRKLKLLQKLYNCLSNLNLSVEDQTVLWQLIFRIYKMKGIQNDNQKQQAIDIRDAYKIYSLNSSLYISKINAAKWLNLSYFAKRDIDKIKEVQRNYLKYPIFYKQELEVIANLK